MCRLFEVGLLVPNEPKTFMPSNSPSADWSLVCSSTMAVVQRSVTKMTTLVSVSTQLTHVTDGRTNGQPNEITITWT